MNKIFQNTKFHFRFKHFIIPILIFIGTWLIYKSIYPEPRNWYDHYLYLAKSLIHGRVDIPDLPKFYQDKIQFNNKIYLPFPPGATFILIPFILLLKDTTQQQVSILIAAIDVALFYILLSKFTKPSNSFLLSVFVGFGTSFFWSAVVGTTWFFAHIVATFFIILSLISHLNKKYYFAGIFLALAGLTRLPLVLAGIFYILELYKDKKALLKLMLGASIFVPIYLFYNWMRFGSLLSIGYPKVYLQYFNSNYPYTIRQIINPNNKLFGYFDIRNIPMHLYTFLIMPPSLQFADGILKTIKPSPYGMGVLFTSPVIFLALKPIFKKKVELSSYITACFCAIPSFLHVMQGWVQFGYRFMLDFVVFLMIILAIRFKPTKINLLLICFSILVNFWGVTWAIQLGW